VTKRIKRKLKKRQGYRTYKQFHIHGIDLGVWTWRGDRNAPQGYYTTKSDIWISNTPPEEIYAELYERNWSVVA